jgi:hypothetical protein
VLADGGEAKLVTGLDDHSRFCVAAGVIQRATARAVCRVFTAALAPTPTSANAEDGSWRTIVPWWVTGAPGGSADPPTHRPTSPPTTFARSHAAAAPMARWSFAAGHVTPPDPPTWPTSPPES